MLIDPGVTTYSWEVPCYCDATVQWLQDQTGLFCTEKKDNFICFFLLGSPYGTILPITQSQDLVYHLYTQCVHLNL